VDKKINPAPGLLVFALACAASYYDKQNNLWILPAACWAAGTFRIVTVARKHLEKLVADLKNAGETKDYSAAFLIAGVEAALVILAFLLGWGGSFGFDPYIFGSATGGMPMASYIGNCLCMSGALLIVFALIAVACVSFTHTFLKSQIEIGSLIRIAWSAVFFVMLSQICGLVDIEKIALLITTLRS
jgi:hypothetical protein